MQSSDILPISASGIPTRTTSIRSRCAVVLLAFLALTGQDLAAQAVLKGRIRAAQSQAPLAMVEVLIENLKLREWTNDSGDFRIAGIPIGSHQLRVRRVGFEGAVATLTVESSDSLYIDLSLNAWIPELEPIYVRAPKRSRVLTEIEERKRTGFGRFLLPEDLRDNEHRQLADLVRQLGVEVLVEPVGNKAFAIGNRTPTIANPSSKCTMTLYVNDIRTQDPDLNRYQVSSLDAVEVYRRGSETPVRYTVTTPPAPDPNARPGSNVPPEIPGAACGVILLWVRGT